MGQNRVIIDISSGRLTAVSANRDANPFIQRWTTQENPEGFKNGLVTNLDQASRTLEGLLTSLLEIDSVELARIKSNLDFYVVIGNKLKTHTFSSSIYFQGLRKSITYQDIRNVISQTRSVATLPLAEHILHTYPVSFIVNDTEGVTDPMGLDASRLGVILKIFTMNYEDFKNIGKIFDQSDIEVKSYYPKNLMTSYAVLSERERQEGVVLADIDEEVTYLTYWNQGEVIHSKSLPFGENFIIEGIAKEWGIDYRDAKKVKERYGSLDAKLKFGDELIPLIVKEGGEKCPVRRQEFHEKYMTLSRKWMDRLKKELELFCKEQNCFHPHYVFCGPPVASDGFLEFMQNQFDITGRIGIPVGSSIPQEIRLNPSFVPLFGLANWLQERENGFQQLVEPQGFLQKTVAGAKSWFSYYF